MFRCFRSYRGWATLGIAIILALYLIFWHGAHIAAVLPFLILLACPLAHLFMHRHHGGHGKEQTPPPPKGNPDATRKA